MRYNITQVAFRVGLVSIAILFSSVSLAAPTTSLADIINPIVEDFEGYTGVDIPASGFGSSYGLPPTGFVFDSGLVLTGPSPNTDDGLVIGDDITYGCCGGAVGPLNIISGTAFAADGNPAGAIHTFAFPAPTSAFGLYFVSNTDVTLTAYDGDGAVIETQVFSQLNIPMTEGHFIGIVSVTPIASFSIESANFFVYDDVTFGESNQVEPNSVPTINGTGLMILILLLAGFGWVGLRRI